MVRNRNEAKELRNLRVIIAVLIICMGALFLRVAWIKAVHGSEYEIAAEQQQILQTDTTIPALRGTIQDINGQTLAKSERVYNVILDCKMIRDADTALYNSTIEKISEILEIPESSIEKFLTEEYAQTRYKRFDEGMRIPYSKQQQLQQAIEKGDITGIWFEESEERSYINGSLMAHVLGFNGSYGVEQEYDENLRGVDGRQMVVSNNAGSFVEEYAAAKDGDTITLTLDSTLQYYMEERLKAGVEHYEAISGCAIAMNPKTGAILGLAVVPTFDLNNALTSIGVTPAFTKEYGTPDSNEEYYQYIWKNYAISDAYEPGSTFKPIFASAALQEAVLGVTTTFYCGGKIDFWDTTIQCAYEENHGIETVQDIIQHSCNIGMTQISVLMGVDRWMEYQDAFGVGHRTGIDLPGETSAAPLVYNIDTMGPVELATTSFGQGFNVTPMQLITAFSAVINGGDLVTPHVVDHITDPYGNLVLSNTREISREVISKEVSDTMRSYLETVVARGTGQAAQVEGYSIGGKTGTAQKHGDDGTYKKDAYVCSFIGFTPVEDPEIVLLVILDEPNDGSSNSPSAVAAEMFADMLPYMNIYPESEQQDDTYSDEGTPEETTEESTEESSTETTDEE